MSRRKISIGLLALAWVVLSQAAASAVISKYIDGPRNEWGIRVETGVHAYVVDTAAHPYVYSLWVKRDGAVAYRVTALTSQADMGNIDLGNPTYGNVVIFYSAGDLGRSQYDIKVWDLDNHAALSLPAGINTSTADETSPSISGDYLSFVRTQSSGASRLFLYRFSTQVLTSIAAGTAAVPASFHERVNGDYLVYDSCANSGLCNVFRRQISTATTVEAPNPGRANYWPTVMPDGTMYYVQGSARYCGHGTELLKWTGSGSATLLAALPQTIEAASMDGYDNGVSTTLYFTRIRCGQAFTTGIYQLPNV